MIKRYVSNGVEYDVAEHRLEEFLKDHPDAQLVEQETIEETVVEETTPDNTISDFGAYTLGENEVNELTEKATEDYNKIIGGSLDNKYSDEVLKEETIESMINFSNKYGPNKYGIKKEAGVLEDIIGEIAGETKEFLIQRGFINPFFNPFRDGKALMTDEEQSGFDLLTKTKEEVATDILYEQGGGEVTDANIQEYIAENQDSEAFNTSVQEQYVKNYINQEQIKRVTELNKQAIIAENPIMPGKSLIETVLKRGLVKSEFQKTEEAKAEERVLIAKNKSLVNVYEAKDIANNISLIDKRIKTLVKKIPKNQEDVDKTMAEITELTEAYKTLAGSYEEVANKAIDISKSDEDLNMYLDAVGRNQGWLVNPVGALTAATIKTVNSLIQAGDMVTFEGAEILADKYLDEDNWVRKLVNTISNDYIDVGQSVVDGWADNITDGLANPLRVDDIDTWGDFGQWFGHLIGSQAPNTAIMLFSGGYALPLLGASATGQSYRDMEREIDLYGAEYTPLQMYSVALGTGLAEALSERVTLGQLNRIKKGLINNNQLRTGFKQYAKSLLTQRGLSKAGKEVFVYGKETFEEGFSETIAGYSQRWLEREVLGKDVDLFEGMKDEFISGAVMSGVVYKSPGIGLKIARAFQPAGTTQLIGELQQQIASIGKTLKDNPYMDIRVKERLRIDQQNKVVQIQQLMRKDFSNMDKMTQTEQNRLLSITDQIYNLKKDHDATINDPKISAEDKKNIIERLNGEYKNILNEKNTLLAEVNVREDIRVTEELASKIDGAGVEVIETNEQYNKKYNKDGKKDSKGEFIDRIEGAEIDGKLVINKEVMLQSAIDNNGNIATASHELLHKILKSEFTADPVRARELKNDFMKVLKNNDANVYEALESRMRSRGYDQAYLDANPDEYLTQFFSLVKENKLDYKQIDKSIWIKIGEWLSGVFGKAVDVAPNDIKFKDGRDVYNFIQNYAKDISEGKLSERAQALGKAGADIKTGTKISNAVIANENAKINQEILDAGVKNADGEIIADENARAKLIDNNLGKVRQLAQKAATNPAIANLEPGKRKTYDDFFGEYYLELDKLTKTYRPENTKGDFGAYMMQNLERRYGAVLGKLKKGEVEGTTSIDSEAAREVVDTSDKTGKVDKKPTPKKEKVSKKVLSKQLEFDKIDKAIAKLLKDPKFKIPKTYKSSAQITPKLIAELFGVNPDQYVDTKKSLTKADVIAARTFINKNAAVIYAALPLPATEQGKSTGISPKLLNAIYGAAEGRADAKLGKSTQGLKAREQMEKPPFDQKAFIKLFTPDKIMVVKNQTAESGMIKALMKEVEKAMVNQAIRLHPDSKLTKPEKQKLAEGKSRTVLSKAVLKIAQKHDLEKHYYKIEDIDSAKRYVADIKEIIKKQIFPPGFLSKDQVNTGLQIEGKEKREIIDYLRIEFKKLNFPKAKGKELKFPKRNLQGFINNIFDKTGALTLKDFKTITRSQIQKFNKQTDINFDTGWNAIKNSVRDNPELAIPLMHFIASATNNKSNFHRAGADALAYDSRTGLPKVKSRDGWKQYELEHAWQSSNAAGFLMEQALDKGVDFAKALKAVKKNYKLIALSIPDNKKLGVKYKDENGKMVSYSGGMGLNAEGKPWNVYKDNWWERYFNPIVGKTDGGIDPFNIKMFESDKSLGEYLKVDRFGNTLTDAQVKKLKEINKKENADKKKAGTKNSHTFSPKLSKATPVNQQIEILGNYDKAAELGRSLKTPRKGISVFDFDNVLAKTNSKVLYTLPNGKKGKLSASQFAVKSRALEDAGAIFDFSQFSKIVEGKKGPLADLAIKRQGKFGSKDIFIVTARPQESVIAIHDFLKGIGLNIPLENITGLEDGTPTAKSNWVAEKAAQGYNDFYFADDVWGNVKAVKEILDQIDVKSEVQHVKLSKAQVLNDEFNIIIEKKTGLYRHADYSPARAKVVGASKGKFNFWIPYSAEDFVGLLYPLLGKGKEGDAQKAWFKKNFLDPFNRAENAITEAKVTISNDFKALKKQFGGIPKTLKKEAVDGFTYEQALRVYIWNQQGETIQGLAKKDVKELSQFIENNPELRVFANELIQIQKGKPYPAPTDTWLAGTLTTDMMGGINSVNRAEYLQEWQENVDIVFSKENLNKLEATHGPLYVEALKNMLTRMRKGTNKLHTGSRVVNNVLDWVNNSVGAIMFLNTKSAVLQTISAINFINWTDNNVLAAGKAFANQPQFWKDFNRLFNSDFLVSRRKGLKINVTESEIADAAEKGSVKGVITMLLKKGFVFTRIADSFAIASGGATFYRNRMNKLMKDGMSEADAEKQAFLDFYDIAEENQQSSRTDRISMQQASNAGRVILAFANTPMQYARLSKKAFLDLKNGRGDYKTNISKIVYYSVAQNLMFNAIQNALFAMMFDDDDDIPQDKVIRTANGMMDSILRGLGIGGAAVSTVKNIALKLSQESGKRRPKYENAAWEMLDFSPPISSKVTKMRSALRTIEWDSREIRNKGFSLDNPAYLAGGQILSASTNIPLDRVIKKGNNIADAVGEESEVWQKVALLLGWQMWELESKPGQPTIKWFRESKSKSTNKRKSSHSSLGRR